jgi:hypothetical protein
VRRPTRSAASLARVAVLAGATMCLARPGVGQSLDGCMGQPSNATAVSKRAIVFVWPCYAVADSFLAPDSRDVEFERDRQMRAQLRRVRELLSGSGVQVLEASGALNLRFVSPTGAVEQVRTTNVDWRGVLVHCPGHRLKTLTVPSAPLDGDSILLPIEACRRP